MARAHSAGAGKILELTRPSAHDGPDRAGLPLLERDRELAALAGGRRSARDGTGGVFVIEGAAGIGKSRLLARDAEQAASEGFELLRARALELEQQAPFGVVLELFGPHLAAATDADRDHLFAGQARSARFLVEPGLDPPPDPQAVVRGLYWLTANLASGSSMRSRARSQPLMIAVDDAQWADRPSLTFLAFLSMRIEELPVAMVVAVRRGDAGAADRVLSTLRAAPGSALLSPRPLSLEGVARLVADELPDPEPEFVAACARTAGGNPFLTRELARALRAAGVAPVDRSAGRVVELVPDAVLHSVLIRLARLGETARKVATALSVLGDGAPIRRVATLAGVEFADAETAADALARDAVLEAGEPLRFAHPLIAAAVRADMQPFARARAHRRAAALISGDGASAQDVAAHLLAATPQADPWSVERLREAARHALAHGDPAAAAQLLVRALAEPPADSQRADVLLELASAEATKGDPDAEDHAREALRIITEPGTRARALRTLSRIHLATGDHSAAAAALREVLADPGPDGRAGQQVLSEYLTMTTFRVGLHPEANAALAPILRSARAGSSPADAGLTAHVALRLALNGERPETIRALAEAATADDPLVNPATHGMPMGILVQALCAVDDLQTAERLADAALAAARRQGLFIAASVASYHRAIPRYHRGALAAALGDLELALAPRQEGWQSGSSWALALRAETEIEHGDLEAAAGTLDEASPLPDSMDEPIILLARARLALAAGSPARALDDATAAGRHMSEGFGIDHPGLLPWRHTAALASVALGDCDQARDLADQALAQARERGVARATGLALRTAAAVADADQRVELLAEAVAVLADSPSKLVAAHAMAELGTALRRAGRRGEAQPPLRHALQLTDQMGAGALGEAIRRELRATGARPRRAAYTGVEALTPAELRVAQLAASGLTDAQIAQELFVTTKTVQTHLSHTYQKLDISSRRQLPPNLVS